MVFLSAIQPLGLSESLSRSRVRWVLIPLLFWLLPGTGVRAQLIAGMDSLATRIPLYTEDTFDGCLPDAEYAERDAENIGRVISATSEPAVYHFAPEGPSKGAIVVVPGGGYYVMAWDWEGVAMAEPLRDAGLHVFVLQYRTPASHDTDPCKRTAVFRDARRAVQLARSRADELGYAPDKVAMMGFSAGGHLTATTLLDHVLAIPDAADPLDRFSSRPDHGILVYPVLYLSEHPASHAGTREALLGKDWLTDTARTAYDLPPRVTAGHPPTLLVHAADDAGVPVANSVDYFTQLREHEVEASLFVYPDGGHGFASATTQEGTVRYWFEEVLRFLASHDYL